MAVPPDSIRDSLPGTPIDPQLPTEALPEPHRRAYFNHRRERDVLGGAQPETWRTRLIKVAALVTTSARRVLVQLSGHWPYLHHYAAVSAAVLNVAPRTD